MTMAAAAAFDPLTPSDSPDEPSDALAGLYAEEPLPSANTQGPLLEGLRRVPTLPDMPLDSYLLDAVALEPMALTEEFARIPGDMARWNELFAEAHEKCLRARLHVQRVRGQKALDIRRNPSVYATLHRLPKLTEGVIEALLNVDADVTAAEDVAAWADRERVRLRGIMEALGRKADALVSIGAHQRAELTAQPYLRETPLPRKR